MITCALCRGPFRTRAAWLDGKPVHGYCAKAHRKRTKAHAELDALLGPIEPLSTEDLDALAERPRTWGECCERTDPCPWVSCRYHLGVDVTERGRLVLVHPAPDEMAEPCALRIAHRGEHTFGQVSKFVGVTRQRVEQLTNRAARRLRRAVPR